MTTPLRDREVVDHPATGTTERGRWLMHGFFSHTFYVYTRRRIDRVFSDGTAAFTILGVKTEVDTPSVLDAVRQYHEAEPEFPRQPDPFDPADGEGNVEG